MNALLPMTAALLDAEDRGTADFRTALGVPVPADWPPEFHGPATRKRMRDYLASRPDDHAFGGYYITSGGRPVGICGFKGPPDSAGMVEIGYSVIASEQRKGYAAAAIRQLLLIGLADARVTAVTIQTIPALLASQRTALAAGFSLAGTRSDADHGEILTYRFDRPGVTT